MHNFQDQTSRPQIAGKTAKRIQSVSMATASLLFSAVSAFGSVPPASVAQSTLIEKASVTNPGRTLPAALVLNRADSTQHDSHASHSSHDSHSSHSSGL
jgi:hypothetical protein